MIVFYCQVSFWSLTKKKRNACFWYFVHRCTDYKKGEGGKRREGDFHLCRKCSYKTQKGVADAWPFLGFSSLRDLRAGKVEKLFNVKRILDIDGSRQWPFYARWKCWKIDVAWCENLVTLCKLVQSILQHFAENVVLCSFNNYPFGCTCRGELLEPHQFFREAPLKLFCWKCFSFPPFTSFHSSPYRHTHQCQSSSVFNSCPLWSDFAQTRLAQGEVPSPESTHCSPRSPAPWIHYYPNFHPVATAALLELLGY